MANLHENAGNSAGLPAPGVSVSLAAAKTVHSGGGQLLIPGITPLTECSRQEAGTPPHLFKVWQAEYGFTVDACAVKHNAKLPHYWTPGDDSLSIDWGYLHPGPSLSRRRVRVFCNPSFGDIAPWLAHALEPELVCYLLPMDRTGREWWQVWKPLAEVHYFRAEGDGHCRIEYVPPPGVTYKSKCGFESCLFLFGAGQTPGLEVWRSGMTGKRL